MTELAFRARQFAAAVSERAGVSADVGPLGLDPYPHDLSSWTARALPGWADPKATAASVLEHFPQRTAALIEEANRIKEGRFRVLGFEEVVWERPINWHLDPVHNKESPLLHWSRVPFLDAAVSGDHKIVWEVNRHTHLVTLAQAYLLTGDIEYARTAVRDLTEWMDANPPKMGVNWASSLEISFRSIAWVWTLFLLRDSVLLDQELLGRMFDVLERNARHLTRNLSTYYAPNTHLTGEALGLLYLGTFLPFLKGAAEWRSLGRKTLVRELEEQVLADGVYYERAVWYQWYVVDFCSHAAIIGEHGPSNEPDSAEWTARIRVVGSRAAEYLASVARPDGSIPLIGDDDGGQLLRLDARPNRHIHGSIALARAAFGGPDYCQFSSGNEPEPLWMLGPGALPQAREQDESRMLMSRAYPFGGVFVMRDHSKSDGDMAAIDAGAHGPARTNRVHSHADALSFDLSVGGQPLFVDPGTFTYTAPPQERDSFRGEEAHNRIRLHGRPVATPGGAFQWESGLDAIAEVWCATEDFDFLEARVAHDEPTLGVTHRRRIMRVGGGRWLIMDDVGPEPVSYELQLQCDSSVSAVRERDTLLRLRRPLAADVLVHVAGPSVSPWHISDGWVSPAYGVKHPAKALGCSIGKAGTRSTMLICEALDATLDVTTLRAAGGECLTVTGVDPAFVMIKDSMTHRMECEIATTDADIVWIWPGHDGPARYLALRGTHIELPTGERVELGSGTNWYSGTFGATEPTGSGPLTAPTWTS